jgi:hypothetical protein
LKITSTGIALLLALAIPALSVAQEPQDDRWRFEVTPVYIWGSGLDGEVTVKGVTVPVDLSFGDILDQTDFAYMGHIEVNNPRYLFFADVLYLDMGSSAELWSSDLEFFLIDGAGGYRIDRYLDAYLGLRVTSIESSLADRSGDERRVGRQTWAKPFVGVRSSYPISTPDLRAIFRVDVSGLGIVGEFDFNAHVALEYRVSSKVALTAGYRYFDTDYSDGEDENEFAWNIAQSGPGLGLTLHF